MYAVLMDVVSKIIKSNLKIKTGYTKADEVNNSVWLLVTLEDIMINFEDVKPKMLAIDDQMGRIMKLKQGESTNGDLLKQVQKELKVYKKHGGDLLWGYAQDTELAERVQNANFTYGVANTSADGTGTTMPEEEVKETNSIAKKALKEKIVAMAVIKQVYKRRYGNLQISLKN